MADPTVHGVGYGDRRSHIEARHGSLQEDDDMTDAQFAELSTKLSAIIDLLKPITDFTVVVAQERERILAEQQPKQEELAPAAPGA